MEYTEILTYPGAADEALEAGWNNVCVVGSSKAQLNATIVEDDIERKSKKALERGLVFVDAKEHKNALLASESWNVDALLNNELNDGRDPLYNKSSGLDEVMCKSMSERNISYIINLQNIILSRGSQRVKLLSRISQNVMLCKKYKVNTVISCCAQDKYEIRTPMDSASVGVLVGMDFQQSLFSVTKNPKTILQKALDRDNPDILTSGLSVRDWGNQKIQKKRRTGWL
jgi:RNase P/RNase MRP subunit p30